MYTITINGNTYKTKYSSLDNRVGWLAPELRNKIPHASETKLSTLFPFVESKADGRKKEIKDLEYFTWLFII